MTDAARAHHDTPPARDHAAHGPGPRMLVAVFGCLLLLTAVTVGARYIDLGAGNVFIALGIALAKTALVAAVFMHLRWDSPFNALILVAALFFVAVFIALSVLDTRETGPFMAGP